MSLPTPAPLRVLFLGPLRGQVGRESAELTFPAGGDQALFWVMLQERFPSLHSPEKTLRLARGDEFLDKSATLRPGEEVALIPPVSGG